MALVLNDRVKETTTTTGTGTVNLAGAETGFETFVAGIGNTNTTYYAIVHQTADEFEVGLGTVSDSSPDTLSRTTIISSSNSDSAVNFSAGTKDVFCTLPASKAVFEDASDNIALGAAPTVSNASGDLTLDVVGSINLDADNNAEVSFRDAGTEIGKVFNSSSDFAFEAGVQDKDILFRGNDGGGAITALTLDMSDAGRAMFNGGIDVGGSAITKTGDLTIDVSGDILLDADGENIKFLDGGTERGQIDLGSANFTLRASTSDKDMIFRVNDGGSEIVALTIDASEEGDATFNNNIKFGDNGKALFGEGLDLALFSDGTDSHIESGGNLDLDVTGNITLDANGGIISLQDNGVETGQLKPDSAGLVLQAVGSDLDIFFSGDDGGSAITAVRIDMSDAGHLICNGNITAFGSTSDIKLKENIEVIPDALDKVKQLKGITFNYKKDGKISTGLIAQDLEKVLPEAVYESSDVDDDEDKHLAIRYGNTVGLLVEAIKELEARVKELENK